MISFWTGLGRFLIEVVGGALDSAVRFLINLFRKDDPI